MNLNCVSISLGSSKRDKFVTIDLPNNYTVNIFRIGVDGDILVAEKIIQKLQDEEVDAIGLGGIDLILYIDNQEFVVQDAKRLYDKSTKIPVVDGSISKKILESQIVGNLIQKELLRNKVLLLSSLDRFEILKVLVNSNFQVLIGDLVFALNVGKLIKNIEELKFFASFLLDDVLNLPFNFIYPIGKEQEKNNELSAELSKVIQEEDIGSIIGDFHYLKKMSHLLMGKIVVTNTLTQEDIEALRRKGVKRLITTGIFIDNRSFGANITDAIFAAYCRRIKKLKISPFGFEDRSLFFEFLHDFLGLREIKGNVVFEVK
ncbi:MAG: quinate 5-dehydrogenase [Candidatus Calescibacterium sp.]|nr:quinate 5-dehydrogenase [Candidatus Calescibacterium sp.]MCX7971801.1 quinate 5-dehydrogenase [bacterium]MDW8194914.1 quinate 5-dehydrogenase [Candidatus Calescibacterium sp.]